MSTDTQVEAGRGLDALVAERVMGWGWQTRDGAGRWFAPPDQCGDFGHERPARGDEAPEDVWWLQKEVGRSAAPWVVPHYSTDIAAAWQVVEAMRERGFFVDIDSEADEWRASFDDGARTHAVVSPTAPLAICRAALAAVDS